MRILVAEDDPVVGDAFEEALRAGHNTVFRTDGVDDTVGRLGDGEVEVAILDVQLRDGTAWEVLDRISSPHPPFRVALVTAVASKEGFVMTADLLNDVWGPAYRTETDYVRVYMRRLRAKLDSVGAANAIESRPGLGYRLTVGAGTFDD